MSTITNTREYRASVIIYKEDIWDLIDMQIEMEKLVKNGEGSSSLDFWFSAASTAAKHVLKWNLAANGLALISALVGFVNTLEEQAKTAFADEIENGTKVFTAAGRYFTNHPTFEAIQVNLSFIEATTDTVWRAAICDGKMENINEFTAEKILVNGIWLEP